MQALTEGKWRIPNHVKFEQGEMWNAAFLNS